MFRVFDCTGLRVSGPDPVPAEWVDAYLEAHRGSHVISHLDSEGHCCHVSTRDEWLEDRSEQETK